MKNSLRLASSALAVLLLAAGCQEEPKLVITSCLSDDDCDEGELCDEGVCVPMSKFRCEATTTGAGILQPAPHVIDFGTTGTDEVTRTVTLRNIGPCSLTIFEAKLASTEGSPFVCETCDPKKFPMEIFPMREATIELKFTAPKVGKYEDKLELLSDDGEFPDMLVPIRAEFDGVPKLVASPDPLNFGYVAQGTDTSRILQLVNRGTGVAAVGVVSVTLDPPDSTAFSLEGVDGQQLPTKDSGEGVTLVPTGVNPRAAMLVNVHYHPREVASAHNASVVIETDSAIVGTIRISLTGTSETPPELGISPEIVDFKDVPLGQMRAQTITLTNKGGSPLELTYSFRNNCPSANPKCSADFSFTPATLPVIEPGKYFEMQVFVTPTVADKINGLLLIGSNDPRRPTSTISLSAQGVNDGTQVVKIEVTYENGSESTFDEDLRRLDVSLENPYGFLCNKETPKPTDWDTFGTPTWMALGAKLNPQRVILVNPKEDGKYRVLLQYTEDCSSLPTQLLASLLGISIDALIAYLTGGSVVLNPGDVSGAIDQNLLQPLLHQRHGHRLGERGHGGREAGHLGQEGGLRLRPRLDPRERLVPGAMR
ncbi:MAG: choice-of-anchor D domain-containing protein [Myxococcales bacterium]